MQPEPDKHERSGGARIGLIRGVLVIITAVAIGAFVVTQGLDDNQTTSVAAASGEVASDADAATDDEGAGAESDVDDDAVAGAEASSGDDAATDDEAMDDAATDDEAMDDEAMDDADPAADDSTDTSEPAGPAIRDPAEVSVLVLNGAGAKGIAGRGSAILQDAGYDVLAPKNADFLGPSLVLYTEGFEAEADGVATAFGVEPSAVVGPYDSANSPINDIRGAAIIVVVGEDGLINV